MIKTKEIDKYIRNVLLKIDNNELTKEECEKVKNIVLRKNNIKGEAIKYDFNDLRYLVNLERVTVEFLDINDELIKNVNLLRNINSFTIGHCNFSAQEKLQSGLNTLIISHSNINEFYDLISEYNSIELLQLIEVGEVDLSKFHNIKNVKSLYIYNSKIKSFSVIKEFHCLEKLKLDGTTLDDENVLSDLGKNIEIQRKECFVLES